MEEKAGTAAAADEGKALMVTPPAPAAPTTTAIPTAPTAPAPTAAMAVEAAPVTEASEYPTAKFVPARVLADFSYFPKYYDIPTSEIEAWGEDEILQYFHDTKDRHHHFTTHEGDYLAVLKGCDGRWLVGLGGEMDLKTHALKRGSSIAFRNRIQRRRFLRPLGLGGYTRPGQESDTDSDADIGPPYRIPGDPVVGGPVHMSYTKEQARRLVSSMRKRGIKLLCLGFDVIVVAVATQGEWWEPAEKLVKLVRPVTRCLLRECVRQGIHLCVTTYSGQDNLIRYVYKHVLGSLVVPCDVTSREMYFPLSKMMYRVGRARWEYEPASPHTGPRKYPHVISALMELEAKRGEKLALDQVFMIDGQSANIEAARKKHIDGLHYDARDLSFEDLYRMNEACHGPPDRTRNEVIERFFIKTLEDHFFGFENFWLLLLILRRRGRAGPYSHRRALRVLRAFCIPLSVDGEPVCPTSWLEFWDKEG